MWIGLHIIGKSLCKNTLRHQQSIASTCCTEKIITDDQMIFANGLKNLTKIYRIENRQIRMTKELLRVVMIWILDTLC